MLNIFSKLFPKNLKEEWETLDMTDDDFEFINQNPRLQFKFINRPLWPEVIRYIDGKDESPIEGFYLKAKSITIRVSKIKSNIGDKEKFRVNMRMNYGKYEDFESDTFTQDEYHKGIEGMLMQQFCIPECDVPRVVRDRCTSMYTFIHYPEIFA